MKILIVFSVSTSLLAMEPNNLEKICQESGGAIYHELCWCDKGDNIDPYSKEISIGSYIDPYFTICTENGPKDKISQIYDNKEPINVNITDFASLMRSYQHYVCDPNLDKLQKGSINVLKDALEQRFGVKYEHEPAKTFNDEIILLWQKIVSELDKEHKNDPDYKNLGEFNNTSVISDIEYFLQQSLKEGLIPLPVFNNDETIFRTKALIDYIFIGIAPIDISKVSIQDLNSNTAHPFRHNFFTYLLGAVSHDLQHSLLMSQNIQRLGIPLRTKHFHYSSSKCKIYKEKFNNILNSIDDNKNSKYAMSLYFSLHESVFYPERVSTRFAFYEFAIERVLKKTLGDLLFHNSSKERTKDLCRQIAYADNKKSYNFLKPIIDVLSINYAERKKEEDIAKMPTNNTLNLLRRYAEKDKSIDYSWYPKLDEGNIATIEEQITAKLLLKCQLLTGNFFNEPNDQKNEFDLASEINKILTTKINSKNLLDKFADMIYRQGKNIEEFYQSFKDLFKEHPYIVDRWSKNMNIWNQTY